MPRMHCNRMLIIQTLVFSRSYLHRQVSPSETLVEKGGTTWGREMADEFCLKMPDFHVTFRDLLHAVNVRHGTNGFTSLPKEDVLRILSLWKIRRLRSGLNPRTWVPNARTLSLDHWSRLPQSGHLQAVKINKINIILSVVILILKIVIFVYFDDLWMAT